MERCFEGLKIVDFGMNIAGPVACSMFTDFGADVIKIERPISGDDMRAGLPKIEGRSVAYLWLNRGKRSLAIPMDDPEGNKILLELVKDADVVLESFRPGVMRKFGLDYESVSRINPRVIYCSITGFGQQGKFSSMPGYDPIAQAATGLMNMTGSPDGPPQRVGFLVMDYGAAHNAFGGIAAALYYREKTGIGQHVDISLFKVGFAMNHYIEQTSVGVPITRSGDRSVVFSPCGIYNGKHGSLSLIAPSPKSWKAICKCMNKPELIDHPDFCTSERRVQNADVVTSTIVEWMDLFDDIETPDRILQKAGVASSMIRNNAEAIALGIEADNGIVVDMEMPDDMELRTVKARGVHIVLSKTPGKIGKGGPSVGEHNKEILQELGYDDQTIEQLIRKWNKN